MSSSASFPDRMTSTFASILQSRRRFASRISLNWWPDASHACKYLRGGWATGHQRRVSTCHLNSLSRRWHIIRTSRRLLSSVPFCLSIASTGERDSPAPLGLALITIPQRWTVTTSASVSAFPSHSLSLNFRLFFYIFSRFSFLLTIWKKRRCHCRCWNCYCVWWRTVVTSISASKVKSNSFRYAIGSVAIRPEHSPLFWSLLTAATSWFNTWRLFVDTLVG